MCVLHCSVVVHETNEVSGYSIMLYCNCAIVGGDGVGLGGGGGWGSVRSAYEGRKLPAGLDTNT